MLKGFDWHFTWKLTELKSENNFLVIFFITFSSTSILGSTLFFKHKPQNFKIVEPDNNNQPLAFSNN